MAEREKPGVGDYIWLAYSIFFFIEPIVRNNRRYWLLNGLIYLVFLAIYIGCVQTEHLRIKLSLLAAMIAIGLVGFPLNAGASCFLTFAIAILPFTIESTAAVVLAITLAGIAITVEGFLAHIEWPNYIIGVFMMVVVGTSNIFIAQKKRTTGKLLRAQEEIERLAALAERERIARDMHDVLGHTLSVIVLKSELARRLLEQAPTSATADIAITEIADVESTARKALAEVRSAIVGYRSEGLAAELDLARRTLRSAGIALDLDTSLDPASLHLSATEETVLSLAVREAVTNIIRHAQATTCLMRLGLTKDGFHSLLVEDNGSGNASAPHEGNGLRGMRERVQSLGGRFCIQSSGASLPGAALLIELPATANLQRAES